MGSAARQEPRCGSLEDKGPDDLAAQIVQAALAKVPKLDLTQIDDPILGSGQPAGEARFRHRPRRDCEPLLLLESRCGSWSVRRRALHPARSSMSPGGDRATNAPGVVRRQL